MSRKNVLYRFLICILMLLCTCHPAIQLAAVQSAMTDVRESPLIIGSLANGLKFAIIPSNNLNGGCFVKLDFSVPQLENSPFASLLTQQALFMGTAQYDREMIVDKLNCCGLDIDGDSYVRSSESGLGLQFSLATNGTPQVQIMLELLNQLVFHPTLEQEDIECIRNRLLTQGDASDSPPLLSISADDVKQFYAEAYRPDVLQITLVGMENSQEALTLLSNCFHSAVLHSQLLSGNEWNGLLSDTIEYADDQDCFVVDGKIWMNEPNWINQSRNGRLLGAALTLFGIAGMIAIFPVAAPVAVLAGGLTTGAGIYFISADYFKDPKYIESLRQTDLKYGCAYAYKKGRAGLTLTPYERRALLLQEMIDRPQTLPNLPILLLADLYQLNDPVIAEILSVSEYNDLSHLKRDFILQRNQYKFLREQIERDLASAVAPLAVARDAALLRAQTIYRQNYYVVTSESLKLQRDATIAGIEKAYADREITLEERDAMIEQAQIYYRASSDAPELIAGLHAAEIMYQADEREILDAYYFQVETAKQAVQYDLRMAYVNRGVQALVTDFDQALQKLLIVFPVYWTSLPDYIDLRV